MGWTEPLAINDGGDDESNDGDNVGDHDDDDGDDDNTAHLCAVR